MAQESETREQARPHLRPVPETADELAAEVEVVTHEHEHEHEDPSGTVEGTEPASEGTEPEAEGAEPEAEGADAGAGDGARAGGGDPPRRGPGDGNPNGLTPPTRRGGSGRFVTDHLIELGHTTRDRVDTAIAEARQTGRTPEGVLLESGEITKDQLARAMAERFGLDHVDLNDFEVDLGAVNLIPGQAAKRFEAIPIAFVDQGTLLVAMADPANVRAVDDISIMTGHDVRPAVASAEDIHAVVARASHLEHAVAEAIEEASEEEGEGVQDIHESAEDAPVIKLVNSVIAQAVEEGASDVHFQPEGRDMRVRFRVDGILHEATTVPRRLVAGVTSRLKIMAGLDIAEKRVPQDGRVTLSVGGHTVDIRMNSLPSVRGEKVVLRLLDKEQALLDLDMLGMQPDTLERYRASFMRPYGAVLVTGPTGSGKTTSLYSALNVLNSPERNVITIEDPVEYQLAGLSQIQINMRAGLTFAKGLRAIVRADPDVIMVGEIRDAETAQIAIESALTGHLVLSTLHTNDAPGALSRLTEMGIEPFLTSSAIDCVVSQRLARVLCTNCKERVMLSAAALRKSGFDVPYDIEAYEPRGCTRCKYSGYKGRIGLYEALSMSNELRELAIERASADQIRRVAVAQGMQVLQQDGFAKVRTGVTSIEEVARVTGTVPPAD
jgi:type IV pilus assembly protein PilB